MTGLPGRRRGRGQRVTVRQPPEPHGRQRRLKAMMDIALRAAARPGQRRLVYLCAALAGVTAGLVVGLAAQVPGRIPADARVVTVTPVFDFGSAPSRGEPDGAFTVTDPAAVAQIVAVIDGLRQLDGTNSCPAEAGSGLMLTSMQLTFRAGPAARWSPPWAPTIRGASSRGSPPGRRPSGSSMRTPAPDSRCSSRSWPLRASAGPTRRASRRDPTSIAQLPSRPTLLTPRRRSHPPLRHAIAADAICVLATTRGQAIHHRIALRCAGPALTA